MWEWDADAVHFDKPPDGLAPSRALKVLSKGCQGAGVELSRSFNLCGVVMS